MLHLTNGEAVSIPETGIPGQVVYWMDILHDGPVPAGLPLHELSRIRERFVAEFLGIPPAEVSFARRDEALIHFRDHDEVVLWFEHDLYDQLQLIQILDWFSSEEPGETRISLIQSDAYLGPMRTEQLARLFDTRHIVTAAEFQTAHAAWNAFCSPDPAELMELRGSDTSALPFLSEALLRHLQQFPSLRNGLSRTERQILEVAESGWHEVREIFAAVQKLEESIWMGDSPFLAYLRGLEEARLPLMHNENGRLHSTTFGSLVLEGKEDHVRVNGIDRWLGGVHLSEGSPAWRWDDAAKSIRR